MFESNQQNAQVFPPRIPSTRMLSDQLLSRIRDLVLREAPEGAEPVQLYRDILVPTIQRRECLLEEQLEEIRTLARELNYGGLNRQAVAMLKIIRDYPEAVARTLDTLEAQPPLKSPRAEMAEILANEPTTPADPADPTNQLVTPLTDPDDLL